MVLEDDGVTGFGPSSYELNSIVASTSNNTIIWRQQYGDSMEQLELTAQAFGNTA